MSIQTGADRLNLLNFGKANIRALQMIFSDTERRVTCCDLKS